MNTQATSKIIFLDVDGVLASHRVDRARGDSAPFEGELDPVAAGLLQGLCEETGAQIVMITTQASGSTQEAVARARERVSQSLNACNLTDYLHDDMWIDDPHDKAASIKTWCEAHGVDDDSYIILDDKPGKFSATQRTRVVSPDMNNGMLLQHWARAQELLGGELSRDEAELARAGRGK